MGNKTANSPMACVVQNSMTPTTEKAINSAAGPPAARALPDATKRPVPNFGMRQLLFPSKMPTSLSNETKSKQDLFMRAYLWSLQWQSSADASP